MTRLTATDICDISSRLHSYDRHLRDATGRSLAGIAAHAWNADEARLTDRIKNFSIHVIPVTAGQGVITDFSETVAAILKFLGFPASVSDETDASGLASAFEKKTDAVMMADDSRFVGINLKTRRVVDNAVATGRVFAAALDLMARGIKDRDVLVMGCGPVGDAAARKFLDLGACVTLYDINAMAAFSLQEQLSRHVKGAGVRVETELASALSNISLVLEATPSANAIPDDLISDHLLVAAPGVPRGVSEAGCRLLENRIIHDKLELGVAAMAAGLVLNHTDGG